MLAIMIRIALVLWLVGCGSTSDEQVKNANPPRRPASPDAAAIPQLADAAAHDDAAVPLDASALAAPRSTR